MTERWTPQAEELVAATFTAHGDTVRRSVGGPYVLACDCGGYEAELTGDWISTRVPEFRQHRAQAILAVLADADMLAPVDGQTREVWALGRPGPQSRLYHSLRHVRKVARFEAALEVVSVRTVTDFPDGTELAGPWREVTDTTGDQP